MKGELEDLGEEYDNIESISKIQTQILNLTSGKVNIFDDNGNFRSTYDILKDISEIYDKLSDPDKADLTEILFGKMRGNQGIAIIQAFNLDKLKKHTKLLKIAQVQLRRNLTAGVKVLKLILIPLRLHLSHCLKQYLIVT